MHADDAVEAFKADLQEVLDRHWSAISIEDEDAIDPVDRAEIGDTYCSGWVLVLSASSIATPQAPSVSACYTPTGQSPFLGIGLLYDRVRLWTS